MAHSLTGFQQYSRDVLELAGDLEVRQNDETYRKIFVGWFLRHALLLCDLSDQQKKVAIAALSDLPARSERPTLDNAA